MNRLLLLGLLVLLTGCSSRPRQGKTSGRIILPTGWDAKAAGDQVLQGLFKVTEPEVRGAHDSRFVIVGDRAYVVAAVNEREAGADAARPFVYAALSIVDLRNDRLLDMMTLARSEQAFANETLPVGACVAPRIKQIGPKTLRCWFASEQPGKRPAQAYYRDFDLGALTFADAVHRQPARTEKDDGVPLPWQAEFAAGQPDIAKTDTEAALVCFEFGGVRYAGWQERAKTDGVSRSLFNIDVSKDGRNWERKYRFETAQSFQSPAFVASNGAVWLSVTHGEAGRQERIMFGRLE
jgi:hypothetical protein